VREDKMGYYSEVINNSFIKNFLKSFGQKNLERLATSPDLIGRWYLDAGNVSEYSVVIPKFVKSKKSWGFLEGIVLDKRGVSFLCGTITPKRTDVACIRYKEGNGKQVGEFYSNNAGLYALQDEREINLDYRTMTKEKIGVVTLQLFNKKKHKNLLSTLNKYYINAIDGD